MAYDFFKFTLKGLGTSLKEVNQLGTEITGRALTPTCCFCSGMFQPPAMRLVCVKGTCEIEGPFTGRVRRLI